MALTNYSEIKKIINEEKRWFEGDPHPEDNILELAESCVPLMYGDIIAEWMELPHDATDAWTQFGFDEDMQNGGIMKLMQIDLELWYRSEFKKAWEDIKNEN